MKTQKIKSNEKGKIMLLAIIFSLIILISLNYVSAYQWACLTYGQSIPRYTCWHDSCTLCVDDKGYSTDFSRCNDSPSCEEGEETFDVTPPVLTINSPVNNAIYDSRSVLFDILSNEPISLYYMDNLDGKENWKRLSSSTSAYNKEINLDEGENSLTIKGIDRNDNFVEIIKSFFVDSKDPKIKKTSPSKGFANGSFAVEFQEDNPTSLILFYGNDVIRQKNLDLGACSTDKGKMYCSTQVNLQEFDGEEISYWFVLEDIAGNTDDSKPVDLDVDMTAPVINNPTSFWSTHENHIMFYIEVTEINFDEIVYIDNSDSKPKEKRICSSLKNNVCEKKVSFKDGHHEVDVIVRDDAGNFVKTSFAFDVVDD